MARPLVADTGGLLRALARAAGGKPSFPDYEAALLSASLVIVPALVLAEVDYFLPAERPVMRKLIPEVFDPATRYEYASPLPADLGQGHETRREVQGTPTEPSPPSPSGVRSIVS